jgi:hypothetical protein
MCPTHPDAHYNIYTCSGSLQLLFWSLLNILIMLWASGVHSLSQMSHSGHPSLMLPLPTFISLSKLSQTLLHVYSHYPTLIYISLQCLFSPSPLVLLYPLPLPCPLPLIFAFLDYLWPHLCIYF